MVIVSYRCPRLDIQMSDFGTSLVSPMKLHLSLGQGALDGSNSRYDKYLPELKGLYRDAEAFEALRAVDGGLPVYWVESFEPGGGAGELITGISILEPGSVGDEYYMTRGHLHVNADRAELYVGLAGRGVMLLESLNGDTRTIEVEPGDAVYVPGYWIHRSVNVGSERFAQLFCYSLDAGQDYAIIQRAGGMKTLVVSSDDGWATRENPDHRGYQL